MANKQNNNRPNFVAQAGKIVFGAVKENVTSSYASNLIDLKNEATEIKDSVFSGAKDAKATFEDFRKNGGKRFLDWFYNGSAETDSWSLEDDDSDFDAGFSFDDDDDSDKSKTSSALSSSDMKDVARGHVNAMYKITGKQVEASMMNTSQLVTTITDAASTIAASVKQTNDLLGNINGKLDAIIKLQSTSIQQQQLEADSSLYNDNGMLSIKAISSAIKESINDSPLGQVLGLAKDSGLSPQQLISGVIELSNVKSRQFKVLGNRSIDEIGEGFNTAVANTVNNALNKVIDEPNFVKKILDSLQIDTNIRAGDGMRNMSYLNKNQYTKDRAVFDGQVYQSIVHIIPEYLRIMTGALTGKNFSINQNGMLTSGPVQDRFAQTASGNLGYTTGLSNKANESFKAGARKIDINVSNEELDKVSTVLVAVVVNQLFGDYNSMDSTLINNPAFISEVNDIALETLGRITPSIDLDYWSKLIDAYWMAIKLDSSTKNAFFAEINKSLSSIKTGLKNLSTVATHRERRSFDTDLYRADATNFLDNVMTTGLKSRWMNKQDTYQSEMFKLQEEIDEMKRRGDKASDIRKYEKTHQQDINRKYEGKEFGDSEESIANIIAQSFEKLTNKANVKIKGGITHQASYDSKYQEDVTTTLHNILDVLNHFDIPISQNPIQQVTTVPRQTFTIKNRRSSRNRQSSQSSSSDSGSDDDGGGSDDSSKLVDAVESLREENRAIQTMSIAGNDNNLAEDSTLMSEVFNGVSDRTAQTKIRNIYQKLSKSAGEKAKDEKDKPKGLVGLLISGATKLFAPLTALLSPVTKILGTLFKPMLQLINKGLKSGAKDFKEGFQMFKEGWFEEGDRITKGGFTRTKERVNKVKGFFKGDEQTESTEQGFVSRTTTDSDNENNDEVVEELRKSTEQAQTADEHAEERHNVIKDILTDIKEKIESKVTTSPVKTGAVDSNSGFYTYSPTSSNAQPTVGVAQPSANTQLPTGGMQFSGTNVSAKESGMVYNTGDEGEGASAEGYNKKQKTGSSKMLAGLGKMGGGIVKILLTLVMSLSAVQGLISFIKTTLVKSLKPLNKAVNEITKLVKPLVKQLGGIIEKVADIVSGIVESLTKALKPVFEVVSKLLSGVMSMLEPVLDSLSGFISKFSESFGNYIDRMLPVLEKVMPLFDMVGSALGDIVDIVGDLVMDILDPLWTAMAPMIDVVMDIAMDVLTPWFAMLKTTVVPLLKIISGSIQIAIGSQEANIGQLITGVGKILQSPILRLTGAGDFGKKLQDTGENLAASGSETYSQGWSNLKTGLKNAVGIYDEEPETSTKPTVTTSYKLPERTAGSGFNLDGTVTNNTDLSGLYSTFGSGDQTAYGSYLNMSKRGCGPTALADAVSRRTGANVNPLALAQAMSGSGNYSTNRGTSVGGFINTANAMGLGYTVGGVTQNSLKSASPRNPITVVGSGTGFGTRPGNTHYVNVIGSKNGTAYTSNPLTGRIERRSVSDIVGGAALGLYGSGDSDISFFSDGVKDAFETLKETANSLFNIFNFDETDSVADKLKRDEQAQTLSKLRSDLGADKMAQLEKAAFKEWSESHKQATGESTANYLARFDKAKNEIIIRLAQEASSADIDTYTGTIGDKFAETVSGLFGVYDRETGTWSGGIAQSVQGLISAVNADLLNGGTGFGGSTGMGGNVLGTVPAVVKAYEAVGVVGNKGDYNQSGKTHTLTINGQTFNERPDCTGFVDSVIDAMGYQSEGMNSARFQSAKGIKDASGNISQDWQFIDNPSTSSLQGGDIGITYKGGDHHGEIISGVEDGKVYGFSYGWEGGMARALAAVNDMLTNGTDALTATKNNKGSINDHGYYTRAIRYVGANTGSGSTMSGGASQGVIDMSRLSPYYNNTWNSYKDKAGIREYFTAAQQAGMSPAQQALIMATGIWEDNAKKLTGQKSLTRVTHDHNGQAAVGIMNWIPSNRNASESTEYGSTLAEQLKYITNAYFSQNPSRSRGKVSSNVNGYASALRTLTGHDPIGKQGDPIGPIIDKDLVEGSIHYVGGALVPEGWQTPKGLGKYVGTAADVYNWMVQNGLAVGGSSYLAPSGGMGENVAAFLQNGGGASLISSALNSMTSGVSLTSIIPSLLSGAVKFVASDNGQAIIGDTISSVGSAIVNGGKSLVSNSIDYVKNLMSASGDKWSNIRSTVINGYKSLGKEVSEIGEDGILQTLKDVGSAMFGAQSGIIGSFVDGTGKEMQAVWDGATNSIKIIAGTAQEVGSALLNGVKQSVDSIFNTHIVGEDVEKGGKLSAMLAGKYGTQVVGTVENASSMIGSIMSSVNNLFNGGSTSTYGSYDSSTFDDSTTTDADTSTTTSTSSGGVATDVYSAYEQSVRARTAAQQKKRQTEAFYAAQEAAARSRNGKSMADLLAAATAGATSGTSGYKSYGTTTVNTSAYSGISTTADLKKFLSTGNNLKTYKNDNTFWSIVGDNIPGWSDASRDAILSYLGSGDVSTATSVYDIPPVDMSKLVGYDTETPTANVINHYDVNSVSAEEIIDRLNSVTFNVSAKRVEELLEKIIEKMDDDKPSSQPVVITQPQSGDKTYEDNIPSQVSKLARG